MKLERVIYCGDNLEWMRQFPDEFVDLCYIDPPFFSNKYYEVIFHDGEEIRAFEDRWKGGIEHYIEWMRERIFEIHRVLKSTGSMYLHCDPTAGHYLKVLMDGVFGLGNFRNEIVWKRTHAHSSSRRYGPVHDIILFYSKSDDFTWTDPKGPYDLEYIQEHFTHVDPATGRQFQPITLTGSGVRHGESGKPWRGIDPSKSGSGRHWALPRAILDRLGIEGGTIQDKLDALDAAGMIYWPKKKGGVPRLKWYADQLEGVALPDVWSDIKPISARAKERLGYPTQKPERLLRRIILASSNEGDLVFDPFCGCGTTLVVAQRYRRRWLGIDVSPTACKLMKRRLAKEGVTGIQIIGIPYEPEELKKLKPFEFQNWVVGIMGGTVSDKKSADMGIDGYSFMERDPIQVKKRDKVGRNVVDNFETAMRRAGKTKGYIVAFGFTKGAYDEVARVRRKNGLEIELLTVRELVEKYGK